MRFSNSPPTQAMRRRRLSTLSMIVALLGMCLSVMGGITGTRPEASAGPLDPRERAGLADLPLNDYGSTGSWNGSYDLTTSTGETIYAYCIMRGANNPPKSGVSPAPDYLVSRGISTANRQALSYALWKYGATTDPITAAAMAVIAHATTNDFGAEGFPNQVSFWAYGGNNALGLDGVVYGTPAWPNGWGAQTKARSLQIWDEAHAMRGPWTVYVTVEPGVYSGGNVTYRTTITVRSAANVGVPGVQVAISGQNASTPSSGTTNGNGQIVFYAQGQNQNDVQVSASTNGPGYYRVFQSGTSQAVVTSGGNQQYSGQDTQEAAEPPYGTAALAKRTTNPAYQSGQGARFEVHRGGASGPVVGTLTVGANGQSNVLQELEEGTYTIIEVSAPEGQVLDPTPHQITVAPRNLTTFEAENDIVSESELTFVKLDDVTDEPLAGAVIEVAYDSDGDGTFETLVGEGADAQAGTADDGLYTTTVAPTVIPGLPVGNYQVTEVEPPEGYTLPELTNRIQVVEFTYGNHNTADDNVLAATANFRDKVPLVRTNVVTAPVENDPETPDVDESAPSEHRNVMQLDEDGMLSFSDEVIVENVAADIDGEITANLYGPFPTTADIVCDEGTLVGEPVVWSVTGSGTFISPVFTVEEPGLYTFVEEWVGEDGSSATHECGLTTETVSVPEIRTQVSEANVTLGDAITDTAFVSGVMDEVEGEITADLYGPFDSVESIVCDETTLVASQTFPVVGSGEFVSPEFTPESAGVYTFVETWTEVFPEAPAPVDEDGDGIDDETGEVIPVDEDGDGIDDNTGEEIPVEEGPTPVTASHECGLIEETTVVQPTIETKVSDPEVFVGDSFYDTGILTGVPDEITGTATFDLFGPFESDEPFVCDETTLVTSVEVETVGSGEVDSPEVTVDEPGFYTFVETWESDSTELTATHDCGEVPETLLVKEPPVEVPDTPASTAVTTTLAYTGLLMEPMVAAGVVLMLVGVGGVFVARRFRSSES